MLDLLLSQKKFEISTALSSRREIQFTRDFSDHEFDKLTTADTAKGKAVVLIAGENSIYLYWTGKKFEGRDFRGGYAELHPLTSNIHYWKKYFKANRSTNLNSFSSTVKIAKSSNLAIISKVYLEKNITDTYDYYSPEFSLYQMFNDLFSAGYEYVIYADAEVTKTYVKFLLNLHSATNADAVQGYNVTSSDNPREVITNSGDWRGFMIPAKTWPKIREPLRKPQNFLHTIDRVFAERKLVRVLPVMDRYHTTPRSGDSLLKKFEIN